MRNILKRLTPNYWFNKLKANWLKSVTLEEAKKLVKDFNMGESKFIKQNLFVDSDGICHLNDLYYIQSSTIPEIRYIYTKSTIYRNMDEYMETQPVEKQIKFFESQRDISKILWDYENIEKYNQKIKNLENGTI